MNCAEYGVLETEDKRFVAFIAIEIDSKRLTLKADRFHTDLDTAKEFAHLIHSILTNQVELEQFNKAMVN